MFQVGKFYSANGLDINCRPIRVRVQLVRILDKLERDAKPMWDCVTLSGGISVYGRLSDLSETK